MKLGTIAIITVFMIIYILLTYYIGKGIGTFIGKPFIGSYAGKVYWIILFFIAFTYIFAKLFSNKVNTGVSGIFELIGAYWMALMFYLLITLPVLDLFRYMIKRTKIIENTAINTMFLQKSLAIGLLVAFIFIMAYGTWSGKNVVVREYNVQINKESKIIKEDGLKVLLVSDIHLGTLIGSKRLKNLVQELNNLEGDLILIAGDIIDSEMAPFTKNNMAVEFKNLRAKYGVYAALGNHDYIGGKPELIVNSLEENGVKVLRDSFIKIQEDFYIVGREDSSKGSHNKQLGSRLELKDIIKDLDKNHPIILIDHQPSKLKEAEDNGVDLQVSGHTHKGQFAPVDLITKMIFEKDYGHLRKGNYNLIVSSGYGTWGPPIRIGSRSEIVQINITTQ